jgi:hypothetical protein
MESRNIIETALSMASSCPLLDIGESLEVSEPIEMKVHKPGYIP